MGCSQFEKEGIGVSLGPAAQTPRWQCDSVHSAARCVGLGLQDLDLKVTFRDFPGGSVVKTPSSQGRGQGSIPGQRTGSHMLQLRPSSAR